MFTPSRKAPSPPTHQSPYTSSPYPTYNPYPTTPQPQPHHTLHHASSDSSIYSTYEYSTQTSPIPYKPNPYRTQASPSPSRTSSLSAPLSPHRTYYPTLTQTPIYTHHSRYPSTSTSSSISSTYIPKELQLLNPGSRNTLFSDLEYISGKKFRFPILKRWTLGRSKSEGEQEGSGLNSRDEKVNVGMGKRAGKLRKEKWEEEIPGVVVIKRGRGVREGNRI